MQHYIILNIRINKAFTTYLCYICNPFTALKLTTKHLIANQSIAIGQIIYKCRCRYISILLRAATLIYISYYTLTPYFNILICLKTNTNIIRMPRYIATKYILRRLIRWYKYLSLPLYTYIIANYPIRFATTI